jgi:hypothetical protein
MLRSLREKLKWASLKNGVIKIGLGLTQAVKSRANAVRLRIRKILTAVFLRPKQDPSPKAKEEPPLQRKNVKAQKAKPSSKTQKPRKSKTQDTAAKSLTKKPRGRPRAQKTGK